ncbi:MAG: MarR family winged helix-turn-helix transcriptional regulator [Nocardioidaceae bacterium]
MSSKTGTTLNDYTGYLLRRAHERAKQEVSASLGDDTHPREALVLSLLDRNGSILLHTLSDTLQVNRTVLVKLVDAVVDKGWVERQPNEADRRSYRLVLTAKGRTALRSIRKRLDQAESRLTATLTAAERAELTETLRRALVDDPALGTPFADRPGYLITQAHRQQRARATSELRHVGLHPRDFGVLTALSQAQPCSQQHLAVVFRVSPPAVMSFIDDLEAAGLVSRVRNKVDRRAYDVALTDEGRRSLGAGTAVADSLQADFDVRLGVRRAAQLRKTLAKVIGIE